MSLLPSGTYASPQNPYYGAGGGGSASLDSPVVVVANAGDGSARLVLPADPAASAGITMGSGDPWILETDALAPTTISLRYEDGVANPVYISIDDAVNSVTLGSGVAGANVNSVSRLEVSDASIVASNVIRIAALSATAGQITNVVAAGGTLTLGSSAANSATMTLTDTATTLTKLGGAPQILSGVPVTVTPNTSIPVTLPAGEGLYAIVGCGVGGTSTSYTRQAQLSAMVYINPAGNCQMGGCGTVDVGGSGGTDSVSLQVNPGGTAMVFYNNSAQSIVAYQIQAFKISGPIPGTV